VVSASPGHPQHGDRDPPLFDGVKDDALSVTEGGRPLFFPLAVGPVPAGVCGEEVQELVEAVRI
jgi:hypothetical protein